MRGIVKKGSGRGAWPVLYIGGIVLTLFVAVLIAQTRPLNAAPDPLHPSFGTCDARMFHTASQFRSIDTSTDPVTFTLVGSSPLPGLFNGMAYNPLDDYVYGIALASSPSSNILVRIGQDGVPVNLGTISGMPLGNYQAGEMAPDGTFYISRTTAGSPLYKLDLTTLVATPLPLSPAVAIGPDLAWKDGKLYTMAAFGASQNILRSIDPVTGAVTDIGTSSPNMIFGAMFGAPNGLFAASNNGEFYSVDPVTGARTLLSIAPAATNTDGAHCVNAPVTLPSDLSITKTSGSSTYTPGGTITYTIVVSNSGPFPAWGAVVDDTLSTMITSASWNCTISGVGTCTASGTGSLRDDVTLNAGSTATYTITVVTSSTATGLLKNDASVTNGPLNADPIQTNNRASVSNSSVQLNPDASVGVPNTGLGSVKMRNGIFIALLTTIATGLLCFLLVAIKRNDETTRKSS